MHRIWARSNAGNPIFSPYLLLLLLYVTRYARMKREALIFTGVCMFLTFDLIRLLIHTLKKAWIEEQRGSCPRIPNGVNRCFSSGVL